MATFQSWMMFVDGENLTIRAQEAAPDFGVKFEEGSLWKKDTFIWVPQLQGDRVFDLLERHLRRVSVRSNYYTFLQGDDDTINAVRESLWNLNFNPHVFKKTKGKRAKGVDISVTKDLLTHAIDSHYEVAVLVAGDADYIPLVDEVKRRGKRVIVAALSCPRSI